MRVVSFTIVLILVSCSTVLTQAEHHSASRHGAFAPRPSSYHEAALELGTFSSKIKRLSDANANYIFTSSIVFGPSELKVIIKPDSGLDTNLRRPGISPLAQNRNADAAYQVSRFIDLVDTPPHVIRDDVPVPASKEGFVGLKELQTSSRGGAGVQIFFEEVVPPKKDEPTRMRDEPAKEELFSKIHARAVLLDELEQIAVFDCLIGNRDRHSLNWFYRQVAKTGQRNIVAIDHSLTFPTNVRGDGICVLVECYLGSAREGQISPANLSKLKELRKRRHEVDTVLRLNLELEEIDLLWCRLEKMLRDKVVFVP